MEKDLFSSEMLKDITALVSANESEINALLEQFKDVENPNQAAVNYLVEKYQVSAAEAEEIVNDINKGVNDFTTQLSDDTVSINDQLMELTADCTEEEAHNCYANILTTLQLLGSDSIEPDVIEQMQKSNLQKGNDELITEIDSAWDGAFNMEQMTRLTAGTVRTEGLSNFVKAIKKSKHNYRLMTALWLYSAQRDGKIKLSDSEVPVSSHMLGALASAGIESIIATCDLSEGKIDLKKWQSVMKKILGTLFVVLLLALSIALIAVAGIGAMMLILSLFGSGIFWLFVAMGVFIAIAGYLGRKTVEWSVELMSWLDDVYDNVIIKITDKVKKIVKRIKEWLSQKKNNNSSDYTNNTNNEHMSESENESCFSEEDAHREDNDEKTPA